MLIVVMTIQSDHLQEFTITCMRNLKGLPWWLRW